MKLIIPLLDLNLIQEDFDENCGFIDAYVHDKNKPYIDDCIFLMYEIPKNKEKFAEREQRFSKCKNIKRAYVGTINEKPYKIFAFPIIEKSDIKRIYKGLKPQKQKNVVRILSFWRGNEQDVNNVMLSSRNFKIDWKTIPEFDYMPPVKIGMCN